LANLTLGWKEGCRLNLKKGPMIFVTHFGRASSGGDQGGGCQILTSINAKFSWK